MQTMPRHLRPMFTLFLGIGIATHAWAATPNTAKSPADNASNLLGDHEARRAKFKLLCANPTASQRETLEIWAKRNSEKFGTEFCSNIEYKYFGTKEKPKIGSEIAFNAEDNVRDFSPIQYFRGIERAGLGGSVTDLSPIANYTELERLSISDSKQTVDISVIANFKNLKTLSLQDTQVLSLAPIAGLSKLEILNLSIDSNTGLPGRKDFEALRNLKNLKQLDIRVAEPLGNQLKDLNNLQSLAIYGPVRDVCSLKGLNKLTDLYLIKNGIQNISCLKDLKELVGITLDGNPIKSLAEMVPLPLLRNLNIGGTLIEDLSVLTGNPIMAIVNHEGAPLRWCSPKTPSDIKKGVSCLNADGTEKPWWKRALRF
jgi:internalin A